jgi:hypothetical protein
MPVDLPPPTIITALAEPEADEAAEAYGPVDTSGDQDGGGSADLIVECPQSSEAVIVICAPVDPRQYRLRKLTTRWGASWDELDSATTIRLGPAEIQPQVMEGSDAPIPAKGVGVGMRIKF